MKIKTQICFLAAVLSVTSMVAQTASLQGFKTLRSNAISPIFEGKEVKGYTMFYKTDKADKGNDNYSLAVYDENLTKTKTITMQKPRNKFLLLGNSYNQNVIGFYFYNFKEDRFEIETFDKTLEKVAFKTIDHKLSMMENMVMRQRMEADEKDQSSFGYDFNLYPVPGKGFIINGLVKNGKGYTLEMFDDKLKTLWKFSTPEKSDEYQAFMINQVTDKYIIGNLIKRPGAMSKKMTYYIGVVDIATGKLIMERPVESKASEQLSLNSVNYDEASDQFMVLGDFYNIDDKPGVAKSKGFYVKTFDPSGKVLNEKMYGWAKDVKKLMPPEANESLEKGAMNYTHKIIKADDGKIYLVCEQFSKSADALGIAGNILGGGYGNSMTKAVVWNIIIFVLKPDFSLAEVKLYTKDKSNVSLPPGADFYGSGLIGMVTKSIGGFDYQFTQMTNDRKSFDIVYVDYDKEKGESTKRILGNIILSPDGKFNLDKMDITTKATSSYLYPAKPGYLMMVDFLRKEKTVGMKLVKLNY